MVEGIGWGVVSVLVDAVVRVKVSLRDHAVIDGLVE